MKRLVYATAWLLIPVACARNSEAPAPMRAAIAGSWVLNEKESQNPLTLVGGGAGGFGTARPGTGTNSPGEIPPRGGDGGTGAAGGRSTGGRSGMAPRGPSRASIDAARAKLNAVQQKLEVFVDMQHKIVIADKGSAINVTYAIGPQISYDVRGKTLTDSIPIIGVLKRDAKWTDLGLMVNQKVGDFKMKEEYTRNLGANRLVVYTRVDGLSRVLEYRRVYDRQ